MIIDSLEEKQIKKIFRVGSVHLAILAHVIFHTPNIQHVVAPENFVSILIQRFGSYLNMRLTNFALIVLSTIFVAVLRVGRK